MGTSNDEAADERPSLTGASDSLVKQADRPFTELTQLIVLCMILAATNFGVGVFWPHLSPFDTGFFVNVAFLACAAGIVLRGVYGAIAQYLVGSNALVWERINISQLRELMAAQQAYAMQQQHVENQRQGAVNGSAVPGAGQRSTMRFEDFLDQNTADED